VDICHGNYILASRDAVVVCTISERELGKLSLEIIVASDRAIGSHYKKLLIL
jgi:hypothetical protein